MELQGKVQNYYFTVDGFDVIPGNCNIAFRRIGNKTVCVVFENTDLLYYGIALCHPEDEFNWKIGMEIALRRALEAKEAVDYSNYTGQVVSMTNYYGFTMGKIYKTVNGMIYDDDGDKRDLSMAISKNKPTTFEKPDPAWFVPVD